jgi:RNA polymerase sigma factor (sigma-70 family)
LNRSLADLGDSILWEELKNDDHDALAQLYLRYVRVLYSYGKKITGNEKIVEDAIQDLFIDIWQGRKNLCKIETARFYLFRSLRRRIHKNCLKDPTMSREEQNAPLDVCDSHEVFLMGIEEEEETARTLMGLIRNLPGRQGEAILLYFYQNFEYNEIGNLLSINEQSARNLIQRAIDKLRKTISAADSSLLPLFILLLASTPQALRSLLA